MAADNNGSDVEAMTVVASRRSLALPSSPGPALIGAFLAGYVVLDWVSFIDPVGPLGITPWNPAPGLALFLLLRYGLPFAPWLVLRCWPPT